MKYSTMFWTYVEAFSYQVELLILQIVGPEGPLFLYSFSISIRAQCTTVGDIIISSYLYVELIVGPLYPVTKLLSLIHFLQSNFV